MSDSDSLDKRLKTLYPSEVVNDPDQIFFTLRQPSVVNRSTKHSVTPSINGDVVNKSTRQRATPSIRNEIVNKSTRQSDDIVEASSVNSDDISVKDSDEVFNRMINEERKMDEDIYVTKSREINSSDMPLILCRPATKGMVLTIPKIDYAKEIIIRNCNPLIPIDIRCNDGDGFDYHGSKYYIIPGGHTIRLMSIPKIKRWMPI